jgi:site-specific DNA-cytosine methylase
MMDPICKFYKCNEPPMRFHPSGLCFQCYQKDPRYIIQKNRLKVLDLFSGLGGFSEAFLLNNDEVLRIENNPLLSEVPHTTLMDVRKLRDIIAEGIAEGDLNPYLSGIDVIVASPPCYEFSLAFSAPQGIATRNGDFEDYSPDMELIEITLEIIDMLKPRYWIIENVRGSIRHFAKIGLEPRQKFQAYVLYGNFPKFKPPILETKAKKGNRIQHGNPLRANYRALIPLELSESVRDAILNQKTIFDFMGECE